MIAVRPPLHAWLALCACVAVLITHGPIRAMDPARTLDTPLLLSAAATWRQGGNPYDLDSIARTFGKDSPSISGTLGRGSQAFVYPPPAYSVLSPLTYLPWSTQFSVWSWLNVVMLVVSLIFVCKIASIAILSRAGFAILGIGLASYPARLNITFGQTAILMFFLMSLSWILVPAGGQKPTHRRMWLSALAIGFAAVIKPQIVAVLAICDVFSSRRIVAIIGAAVAVTLFFGSLAIHGDATHIIQSWVGNMNALMQVDANPLLLDQHHVPHDLINLQSPLAVLTGNKMLSSGLAVAACALMAGWLFWIVSTNRVEAGKREKAWLNELSATIVLMLLVFYHRAYDAIFLMIPVAFAIRQILAREKRGYVLFAVLTLPMIASPSNVFRLIYPTAGGVPNVIVEALLVQYHTWALVAAFLLLCRARYRPVPAGRLDFLESQSVASDPTPVT
jgi:hypothetical protein